MEITKINYALTFWWCYHQYILHLIIPAEASFTPPTPMHTSGQWNKNSNGHIMLTTLTTLGPAWHRRQSWNTEGKCFSGAWHALTPVVPFWPEYSWRVLRLLSQWIPMPALWPLCRPRRRCCTRASRRTPDRSSAWSTPSESYEGSMRGVSTSRT